MVAGIRQALHERDDTRVDVMAFMGGEDDGLIADIVELDEELVNLLCRVDNVALVIPGRNPEPAVMCV